MTYQNYDQIHIKNLEIFAHHGVFPEENKLGQKFLVSATLYTGTRQAGKHDDLTQSIHYGEVSQMITEYLQQHTWKLLETVVENLAEEMLLTIPRLEAGPPGTEKALGSGGTSAGDSLRGDRARLAYRLHCAGFQHGRQAGVPSDGRR